MPRAGRPKADDFKMHREATFCKNGSQACEGNGPVPVRHRSPRDLPRARAWVRLRIFAILDLRVVSVTSRRL